MTTEQYEALDRKLVDVETRLINAEAARRTRVRNSVIAGLVGVALGATYLYFKGK